MAFRRSASPGRDSVPGPGPLRTLRVPLKGSIRVLQGICRDLGVRVWGFRVLGCGLSFSVSGVGSIWVVAIRVTLGLRVQGGRSGCV